MAAYREEEDPFEEDIVFDQAGLLNSSSKINTAIRRVSSGKCVLFAKTLGLCGAFFGLGLCIAIPGPTFLSPLTALEVNVSNIYVARSCGYLIGAIIGGMLFDHFNRLFLLFLSLLLTSVFITVAPWCQILWLQVTCMVTLGITMGFLDTGGNVLCLDLWGRNSGPFMQALHFSFGLGAFVAPLLAVPFLEPTSLNATLTTDVSQFVTEYPVHIIRASGADTSFLERLKRDIKEFNETNASNKSQIGSENIIADDNSFLISKIYIPTESTVENFSHSSEVNGSILVTPEFDIDGSASAGTVPSVPNTMVKQKTLKHKPSKTDGTKLGNKNWDSVHVGKPPLADLMPATTTSMTKLNTVLDSTTVQPVLSYSSKNSNELEEKFLKINHENSSQVIGLVKSSVTVTQDRLDTSLASSVAEISESLTKEFSTTEKIKFVADHQGNVEFLNKEFQLPSFRNDSDALVDKQKPEWIDYFSSTQFSPASTQESSTVEAGDTVQPSEESPVVLSDKDPAATSTYLDMQDVPISSVLSETSMQPPLPHPSIQSTLSSYSVNVPDSINHSVSEITFQKLQLSPQDRHVTKGSSLGHEEYYVQNSRSGDSFDPSSESSLSDSRILSNDNDLTKGSNESKLQSKINGDYVYNPAQADSSPLSDYLTSSEHSLSLSNEDQFLRENDTKSKDFQLIPDPDLQFTSVVSTSTISSESDGLTSSLNYINSAAISKHVHRKPGTFDNDTEHINTIFDVFANRIEKYGFSKLQFSYLIVGIFVFSVSIIFLGFLCHNPRDPKSKQEEGQGSKKIVNKTVHKILVSLMAFFFFLYLGLEVTYGQLVLAFAMHSNLKLSQSTGSVICVVFWGSFAAMRFASIFFASGFSPNTMLILNFVFCTTGTLLVSAFANHVETALWVGTALIGIGLASMFPTGILWIERYIHVSNKVAAIFVIGVSLGQMICPICVYRLMLYDPQMLMHSSFVINILCILTFVALWWFASQQGEKYSVVINNGYQLASQNDEEEDMLDMSPSGSDMQFRRHSFSSEHRALLNGNVHRGP